MEQISVEIRFGIAEVLWVRTDGTFHRKTYDASQKGEFLTEVIDAANYADNLLFRSE